MNKISIIIVFTLCVNLSGISGYAEPPINKNCHNSAADVNEVLVGLEERMAEVRTMQCGFIQEKELAIFKDKIILKGRVFLQKPRFFAWHVQEPLRYSMVIKDDLICQWDEGSGRVQKISLKNNPGFGVVITQMKEWFSGAYISLQNDYEIAVRAEKPIKLEFIPRENTFPYSVISRVTVIFREDRRYIQSIYIEEKSGDNTFLSFIDTRLNLPLDAAVWEVQQRVR